MHRDITVHFPLEASLTQEELSPIINYWKNVLVDAGVKPKDKIGIIISFLDTRLANYRENNRKSCQVKLRF